MAFALLAALLAASALAQRLRGTHFGDLVWTAGAIGIVTSLVSARMLVIACNLRDFAAHPFWMLGLNDLDDRYVFGGLAIGMCSCLGYVLAHRLDLPAVLDAMTPAASLGMAIASLGSFAGGSDFGIRSTARWGVVYTSRLAARWSGTPLGVPLIPVQLYECVTYVLVGALALWALKFTRRSGDAAGLWLFAAGLAAFFLDQLRYLPPTEWLVADAFTLPQCCAMFAVLAAGALWLRGRSGNPDSESA